MKRMDLHPAAARTPNPTPDDEQLLASARRALAIEARAVEALTRENIMPDDCVFVGNSPVNDIAPAQRVGFKAVLFAPEGVPESAIKPDLVIHNLSQLLEWL